MKRIWPMALVFAVVLAGCSSPSPGITDTPLFTLNPSGKTPLAGLLTFTTDQPVRVQLTISDDEGNELIATPNDEFETDHELIVLGLRPDRMNSIVAALEDASGEMTFAFGIDLETRPLPDWVPPIDVSISRPPRMEPGITMLPVGDFLVTQEGFIVALDSRGDILWFYEGQIDEPRRMMNGNLLIMGEFEERQRVLEMDMLGRVINRWDPTGIVNDPPEGAIPVAVEHFHHDVLETPAGNFIALTTERRRIENYPTSETDLDAPREPRDVIGDRIVEFVPATGEIVREWSLYNLIDRSRISNQFGATEFYEQPYEPILDEPRPDWTHSNGMHYDAATDSLIVSIRKQNAVIKIDLAANELVWILGNHTGWAPEFEQYLLEPIGDLEWSYGHHAPELTPSGTLLLYDNGSWGRAQPPFEPQPLEQRYSRGVEYEIDEENMTVRQVWSYGDLENDRFYSSFVSEADTLPQTGNILLVNGGQTVDDASQPFEGDYETNEPPRVMLSVMELTHETPAEKVWEISIDTLDHGWGSFRAERWPGIYP